jgi:hypothetical protein
LTTRMRTSGHTTTSEASKAISPRPRRGGRWLHDMPLVDPLVDPVRQPQVAYLLPFFTVWTCSTWNRGREGASPPIASGLMSTVQGWSAPTLTRPTRQLAGKLLCAPGICTQYVICKLINYIKILGKFLNKLE